VRKKIFFKTCKTLSSSESIAGSAACVVENRLIEKSPLSVSTRAFHICRECRRFRPFYRPRPPSNATRNCFSPRFVREKSIDDGAAGRPSVSHYSLPSIVFSRSVSCFRAPSALCYAGGTSLPIRERTVFVRNRFVRLVIASKPEVSERRRDICFPFRPFRFVFFVAVRAASVCPTYSRSRQCAVRCPTRSVATAIVFASRRGTNMTIYIYKYMSLLVQ